MGCSPSGQETSNAASPQTTPLPDPPRSGTCGGEEREGRGTRAEIRVGAAPGTRLLGGLGWVSSVPILSFPHLYNENEDGSPFLTGVYVQDHVG